MKESNTPKARIHEFDAIREDGKAIAEIKFSADALRTVRGSLNLLAYGLQEYRMARAFLVLVEPAITAGRLKEEWQRLKAMLKPEILSRLSICLIGHNAELQGIPENPTRSVQDWLRDIVDRKANRGPASVDRVNYGFIIRKLLIHQWLIERKPVTTKWLASNAGCSYPTVARVLRELGSLIHRGSDRRVALRFLPQKELSQFVAISPRARSTARFVDQSGQPRGVETHLKRLQKIRPSGVAIGGVLGARHYVPALDLAGTPRLDLSMHCGSDKPNFDFVKVLDPALVREEDSLRPANVIVHAIRHDHSLFCARKGGLAWADPVECLLDLHEAGLESQANQFLSELQSTKKHGHHA